MADRGVTYTIRGRNQSGPAFNQLQRELKRTANQTNVATLANKRFSQSLGGSSWRRQVQQAGMQVSDFSVQVAGGQSAMLAFTQNAPQFIQNFGAMGGVIAAGVTILGTLAFTLMKSSAGLRSFSDQAELTTESLDAYFGLIRNNPMYGGEMFRRAEESLKTQSSVAQATVEMARVAALLGSGDQAGSLARMGDQAKWLRGEMGEIATLLNQEWGPQFRTAAILGATMSAPIREFRESLEQLEEAKTIQGMHDAAIRLRDVFHENVAINGDMTDRQVEFAQALYDTIRNLELMGAAERANAEARLDYFAQIEDARRQAAQRQRREETQNAREIAAAQVEYRRIITEAQTVAARQVRQQIRANAAAEQEATMRTMRAHQQYAQSRVTAQRLFLRGIQAQGQQARTLALTIRNITFRNAIAGSRALSSGLGRNLQQASRLRGLLGGLMSGMGTVRGLWNRFTEDVAPTWGDNMPEIEDLATGGGGGGGGAVEEITNELTPMQKAMESVTQSVKSFSDSIADAIVHSKSLADVFVNGIKRMASNLISSGLQTLIMETFGGMMGGQKGPGGSIGSMLLGAMFPGSGLGGGFGGGFKGGGASTLNSISFAGGGYTGRGARVGGLDGQGGRLAMIHPNETVTDHSRGGGGAVGVRVWVDNDMTLRAAVDQRIASSNAEMNRMLPQRIRQIGGDPYRNY